MTYVKGMREVLALRSRRGTTESGRRGQLTAQMSRLDHQRSLLERQLSVWIGKAGTARERISAIDQQIDEIERNLRDIADRTRGQRMPIPPKVTAADAPVSEAPAGHAPTAKQAMSFEY